MTTAERCSVPYLNETRTQMMTLTQTDSRAVLVALKNNFEGIGFGHSAKIRACIAKLTDHALAGNVNSSISSGIVVEGSRAMNAAMDAAASASIVADAIVAFDAAVAADAEAA